MFSLHPTLEANRAVLHPSAVLQLSATVVACAALLLAPALINGAPFMYFDTASYIETVAKAVAAVSPNIAPIASSAPTPSPLDAIATSSPISSAASAFGQQEGDPVVLGGRSVYFGALAYVGWLTTIWLPLVVSAVTLAWLLVIHARLQVEAWGAIAVGICAILAFGTSAGIFTGLLMPDIWAAIATLACARLWMAPVPSRGERVALIGATAYAALVHNSHLALVVWLMATFFVFRLVSVGLTRSALTGLAGPGLALLIGITGLIAHSTAAWVVSGKDVLNRPHITAHLVDLGPGTQYAQKACPQEQWEICHHVDKLPIGWVEFLFERDQSKGVFATADANGKRALVKEQAAFALATLRAYPSATLFGLLEDGVRQLWTLGVSDVALTNRYSRYLKRAFPKDLLDLTQRSALYPNPHWLDGFAWTIRLSSLAGAIILVGWGLQRALLVRQSTRIDALIAIGLSGVIGNAAICGILASPYGRFQARITWILPFLALMLFASKLSTKHGDNTRPTGILDGHS